MSAADKFTPAVRDALRRCHRDGAVLRKVLAGRGAALLELGLIEGEEGMIACTEAGKVVWTLLAEIETLNEAIARMRKSKILAPPNPEEIKRLVDVEIEKRGITGLSASMRAAVTPRSLPGSVQSQGMSCGQTNTDTFQRFLERLPPDPFSHRPAGAGPAAADAQRPLESKSENERPSI